MHLLGVGRVRSARRNPLCDPTRAVSGTLARSGAPPMGRIGDLGGSGGGAGAEAPSGGVR
jgi:hypothetical protein